MLRSTVRNIASRAAGAASSMKLNDYVVKLVEEKSTTTDVYSLADVSSVREWNYELPTVTVKSRFTQRQPWNSSAEFAEAFFSLFPLFKNFDMSNIAVMGGAVFDLLHQRESHISDIDLFIVGDLPGEGTIEERVIRRAEKFIDDVNAYLTQYVAKHNADVDRALATRGRAMEKLLLSTYTNFLSASRNGSVITFNIPLTKVPIQLVLCPHRDVSDLLRKVDLDCTAIAFFEGKEIKFSPISKFCFENGCTIVSKVRGNTFEARLAKYFSEKEIDIVLPRLDISKIPKRNLKYGVDEVIDLSTMAIVYSEIAGQGKIITSKLIPTEKEESKADGERDTASETDEGEGSATTAVGYTSSTSTSVKNAGVIIHENIIHLLHSLPQRLQFHGEGKYIKDVLLHIPKLTNRMITNSFETVKEKLQSSLKEGKLPVDTFEKYFTVKPTSLIVKELLVAPMEEREARTAKTIESGGDSPSSKTKGLRGSVQTLFVPKYNKFVEKYLDELVEAQIKETGHKLAELEEDYKANPEKYRIVGDQPFIQSTTDNWYGKNYVK